jgi:hypothetical protein
MMIVTTDNDLFSTTYKEEPRRYREDPLVLSIAVKDLATINPGVYYPLDDLRVDDHVNDDHREMAEKIRKYYGKKFLWSNLSSNSSLSDFRTRVCYLLENHVRECVDRDSGIYYKLPYFYEEDMSYDQLKKQYNTTDVPRIDNITSTNTKHRLTLTYVKTTSSRQKQRNVNRFWFTDGTYLYSIGVTNDNPLLELFRQLVTEKMTITFDTCYNVDRLDQMYFYKLYNFTLTKDSNA